MPADIRIARPKAVVFDWDNTLVDNWPTITEALNKVHVAFGRAPWTLEETKERAVKALRDSFPEWFGDEWPKAREIFYDHFDRIHLDFLTPLNGSHTLLQWLHQNKIPQFVVSNKKGDAMRREMEHLGWAPYFSSAIGSLDAPRDKPERDPIDLALSKANMKADDPAIWYVGDTHIDMEAARASGCTPVFIGSKERAGELGIDLTFIDCAALHRFISELGI